MGPTRALAFIEHDTPVDAITMKGTPMPDTLAAVNDILRERDPESLIEIGCPPDEYASEAEALHAILCERPLVEQDVINLWLDWMGESALFLSDHDAPARADLVAALNALRT